MRDLERYDQRLSEIADALHDEVARFLMACARQTSDPLEGLRRMPLRVSAAPHLCAVV